MIIVTWNPTPSIVVKLRLYVLSLKSKEDKHLNAFDYIHAALMKNPLFPGEGV